MVNLREITADNLDAVLALKPSAEQSEFVQTTACSLAKAWVFRSTAYPFAVYADNKVVGFIMLGYYEQRNQYTIWQFLIDRQYQRRGYGRAALKLGIKFLVDNFHTNEVYLGVKFQNTAAYELYSSLGFVKTGETSDTGYEMKLLLTGR